MSECQPTIRKSGRHVTVLMLPCVSSNFEKSPITRQIDDISGRKRERRYAQAFWPKPALSQRSMAVHFRDSWTIATMIDVLCNSLGVARYNQRELRWFWGWISLSRGTTNRGAVVPANAAAPNTTKMRKYIFCANADDTVGKYSATYCSFFAWS